MINFHHHFQKPGPKSNNGSTNTEISSFLPTAVPNNNSDAPLTTTVPEFLYQLTKMLTDDNKDVIEWANGTS